MKYCSHCKCEIDDFWRWDDEEYCWDCFYQLAPRLLQETEHYKTHKKEATDSVYCEACGQEVKHFYIEDEGIYCSECYDEVADQVLLELGAEEIKIWGSFYD